MYRVRYGNDDSLFLVAKDIMQGFKRPDQATVDFTSKRAAQKALAARAKYAGASPSEYTIVKLEKPETAQDKVSTEDLADKLLTAVTAEYKDDRPTPGLVLSKLPDGQVYASVARYNQKQKFYPFNTEEKVIVAKTTNKSVRGAIIALSQTWLQNGVAKDALASAMKGV